MVDGARLESVLWRKPHEGSNPSSSAERWLSGLKRTPRKRQIGQPVRGFESRSLIHFLVAWVSGLNQNGANVPIPQGVHQFKSDRYCHFHEYEYSTLMLTSRFYDSLTPPRVPVKLD